MTGSSSLWWDSSNGLWPGRNFCRSNEGVLQNSCEKTSTAWMELVRFGDYQVFKERERRLVNRG